LTINFWRKYSTMDLKLQKLLVPPSILKNRPLSISEEAQLMALVF
jgi:hypothetical protein